jgi:hypothetical protein
MKCRMIWRIELHILYTVCLGKGRGPGNWKAMRELLFLAGYLAIAVMCWFASLLLEMEEISMSGYGYTHAYCVVVCSGSISHMVVDSYYVVVCLASHWGKRKSTRVGTKGGCNWSALNKGTAVTCFLPTLAGCCGLQWQSSSFSHVTCMSSIGVYIYCTACPGDALS